MVAVTLLYLMFSTGRDEFGERKAFFGSLVFETMEKSNGATAITAGVDDPVPIIILFLALTAIFTMIQIIYQGLRQRRDQLLNDTPSEEADPLCTDEANRAPVNHNVTVPARSPTPGSPTRHRMIPHHSPGLPRQSPTSNEPSPT